MDYTKITCILENDNEIAREMLMAELGEAGFESFVETEDAVEAYIPSINFSPEILMSPELQQNQYFAFQFTTEFIADQNWNEVWEKNYFEPLLIENRCVVRAPFHQSYPTSEFEIIINPKMAFGTGNHETTHMMVKIILGMELNNQSVLDMGCGSGILAILASQKGASEVTAIDIDEWSYNNTLENADLNEIKNITAFCGDSSLLNEQQFDTILANIQRNILLEDMKDYHKVLKKGGHLLMSGFYTQDLEMLAAKASELGLKLVSNEERSNWCAALFVK